MKKTRILLADDDRDQLELLRRALESASPNAELICVSGGEELLTAARHGKFDCIILDFNMPPVTAIDLLPELERLHADVPRLVISCSAEQRVVVALMRRGVTDFVHKDEALDENFLWERVELAIERASTMKNERRQANRRLRILEQASQHDVLTGLLNRSAIERAIESPKNRNDRRGSLGVIFIDLDHFKRVNDTLGHHAGDEVLRSAAEVISRHASKGDLVARWGGEEFVVLRQSNTVADAWIWADRVRREIAAQVRLPADMGLQTASLGVDVVPTKSMGAEMVTRADQAMYMAKESGRNRVCTSQMVRAMDIALELGSWPGMSLKERVEALREKMRSELGPTQLEHIGPHGERVRDLSMRVAELMPVLDAPRQELRVASEFHDLGKISVPESILALPRHLEPGERRFMAEHARFGAELLAACGAAPTVTEPVAHHHDRFDATDPAVARYPLSTAVLSACDAVVAMMSARPYSEPKSVGEAVFELKAERTLQFSPGVVDVLASMELGGVAAA